MQLLFTAVVSFSAAAGEVDSLKGVDVGGRLHWLGREPGVKAIVLVFLHPECPVANQYVPELNRIATSLPPGQVQLFGVLSNAATTRKEAARYIAEFKPNFPVLFDAAGELAQRFEPTRVPEAFVLTHEGEIRYRGRIDDQWAALGKRRTAVTRHDLVEAIRAVVENPAIAKSVTEVVGCVFEGLPRTEEQKRVTYHRHIAPIVQNNCQGCHRPGEVAPFALTSFEETASRADMLAEVTASGLMPPWIAEKTYHPFHGERRLSAQEKRLLANWAAAGAPAGNPDDAPPARRFSDGWQLGEPDLVLKMPEPFLVPASGPDLLRYFVIPIPIGADKDVVAFEFRPGNRRVCHHAILYVDSSGTARRMDEKDPAPGYAGFGSPGFQPSAMIGFWAPGYTPHYLAQGASRKLPHKNADLALQLHYHPSGKEESDQSVVGLYFAKSPTPYRAAEIVLGTLNIDIPAGETNYRVGSTLTLPAELEVVGITPHMHLIGKEMKLSAKFPDGKSADLLWIKNWNFNWQDGYRFVEPVILPQGTIVELTASYDNSADNPANPNSPPKPMLLGEESTDEMCLCVLHSVAKQDSDNIVKVRQASRELFRKEMTPELIAKLPPAMKADIFRTLIGRRLDPGRGK